MAQVSKLPPQNIDAEQAVLGSMLIDKDAVVKVAEILHPAHFYRSEQHGRIYEAILKLFEKREPVDMVTVTEALKRNEALDLVGGSAYLASLVNIVPTSAHIEHYAKIIRDHAIRRSLIASATTLIQSAYDESTPLDSILDQAEQTIFSLSQETIKRDFVPLKDLLTISFDRLDELQRASGKLRGVSTGFRDLDNKLAGFQDSNLIIVAARPGLGKTSFCINVAQHVAVRENLPVGIFSLEMSQEELIDRILVTQADIDAWKLKTGKLDEKDFDRISHAMGELAEAPLFIDDTPGLSLAEMRTKARRLQLEHGLKLLIVDYLQLIRGRNLENRVQEVAEISQGLKNLAREMKIPVVAVSQLSRAVETRGTRRPQLADLRESGCLAGDTKLMRADTGEMVTIKELVGESNIPIFSLRDNFKLEIRRVSKVFSSGKKRLFELKVRTGRVIQASANHPFLTLEGWKRLDYLQIGERIALTGQVAASSKSLLAADELIVSPHLIGDGYVLLKQPIADTFYKAAVWGSLSTMVQTADGGFSLLKNGLLDDCLKKMAPAADSRTVQNLVAPNLYWEDIVSITPKGVEEVFDATVPGTHNFVADDFIVHNSIEQDADVVMFLYREDPESQDDMTLDIQKHRNGPTGEIKLYFRADRVKFYGMEKTKARAVERKEGGKEEAADDSKAGVAT